MNSQNLHREFPVRSVSKNGTRLILSVDDEPGILFTREKILEAAGYKVLSAADGKEALSLFDNHPIDLVLLDYAMPGMDGGSVAQEMKRRNQSLPVIMVSASPLANQALICADCFVDKGQGPARLLEQISQLLTPCAITPAAHNPQAILSPEDGNSDGNSDFNLYRNGRSG